MAKLPTQYKLPGKGRKLCSQCGNYVGVRTFVCECGHEFIKGENKTPITSEQKNSQFDEPLSDEDRRYALAVGLSKGCVVVHAGSGWCPSRLQTTDYKGVSQFCEDIMAHGVVNRKLYLPSAIKRWIRDTVPPDDEDYKYVSDMVDQWYNEKVNSTMGMEI